MDCEGVIDMNSSEIVKSSRKSADISNQTTITHLDLAPGAMEGSVVKILEGFDIKQFTASVYA